MSKLTKIHTGYYRNETGGTVDRVSGKLKPGWRAVHEGEEVCHSCATMKEAHKALLDWIAVLNEKKAAGSTPAPADGPHIAFYAHARVLFSMADGAQDIEMKAMLEKAASEMVSKAMETDPVIVAIVAERKNAAVADALVNPNAGRHAFRNSVDTILRTHYVGQVPVRDGDEALVVDLGYGNGALGSEIALRIVSDRRVSAAFYASIKGA